MSSYFDLQKLKQKYNNGITFEKLEVKGEHVLLTFTLIVFFIIFVYAAMVSTLCSNMMLDPQFSESKYNISLQKLYTVNLLNMITIFISLIVMIFISFKFMSPPNSPPNPFLNRYVAFIFALYVLGTSIFTLVEFDTVSNISKQPIYNFSIAVSVLSAITIIFYLGFFVYSSKKPVTGQAITDTLRAEGQPVSVQTGRQGNKQVQPVKI